MPSTLSKSLSRFFEGFGAVGLLSVDFLRDLLRGPLEVRLFIDQLDNVGWRSLTIINLTAIFTGMVLALQMGEFLGRFGAKIYVSRIMGISLLREMGPVLTALMIGARVGAGISAEIGSMAVTEQIDALRALATSPIKRLVVPRVMATVIMLPLLTVVADAVGLLGGLVISVVQLGLTVDFFFSSLVRSLTLQDLLGGLMKAAVFGYIIAIVACAQGLGARGGADGVGRATTSAVVVSAIAVLVSDFFLSKLLLSMA